MIRRSSNSVILVRNVTWTVKWEHACFMPRSHKLLCSLHCVPELRNILLGGINAGTHLHMHLLLRTPGLVHNRNAFLMISKVSIYNYIEGVKTRKASLRSSEWNNPALLAASHPRPFFVHSNHSRMPFWDCEVQHRKSNWWHHWAQLSLPQRSNKNTEMLVIRTNHQHTYTHQT